MVPEPVGSTHLRFGDARVVMGIVCGYRKLFGVPDEIYIWEVLFWPSENVRDFSVLYREGSRRFRSGAHLHGGTHMNVGSGGKAPHPWSRRTKIPP